MKWVKVAIGVVIAISVIPMIILTINNLTETRGYEGEIELVINNDNKVEMYELLLEITEVDNGFVTNAINGFRYNNTDYEYGHFTYSPSLNRFSILDSNYEVTVDIGPNETLLYDDLKLVILADTLEVVNKVPPIIITLIGLVPLIYISGLISILYKKQEL